MQCRSTLIQLGNGATHTLPGLRCMSPLSFKVSKTSTLVMPKSITRYESTILIVHVPRPFRVHELEFSHVPGVLLPMLTLVAPYYRPNAKGCFKKAKVPNQFSHRLASPSVKTFLACIESERKGNAHEPSFACSRSGWLL
ncbi:uncharacterized protein G2W53_028927 [Senna tora]|uniref:Uncharacterized protein n=1 Tax=Senna tora TaxID=362788 RepID=A0A834T1Y3_9FABA|nr:uncharacterized protein G2W53_028927 [Senna tora]